MRLPVGAKESCTSNRFEKIWERALPHLQTRHNEIHTRISREFAQRLLAAAGGTPDVVLPAILLHDIGWSQVPEEAQLLAFGPNVKDPERTRVHERAGAAMAGAILRDLSWSREEADWIVHIIAGHDTRVGSGSLEESVVRDADKLFRVSSAGFRIDYSRFGLDCAEYLGLLESKIEDWFFTETGADIARDEVAARRRELRSERAATNRRKTGAPG